MRVAIHAVGRLKAGPERELSSRYLDRFARVGPGLGLEFGGVSEHAEGRDADAGRRMADEADRLLSRIGPGDCLMLLDEGGRELTSRALARQLARERDDGTGQTIFAIGGPDGNDPRLAERARLVMAFGRQTWPHQLVRIMLAEQLYRAATILAGHPYHRD